MTLESDGNDDLPSVTVEKRKDTLISTTSEANADKAPDFYLSKRQFAELRSDYASKSDSNERQQK